MPSPSPLFYDSQMNLGLSIDSMSWLVGSSSMQKFVDIAREPDMVRAWVILNISRPYCH